MDAYDRALQRLGVDRTVRIGHARVIQLGGPDKAPTQTLRDFDATALSTAWIAEMRSRGGVR